MVVQLGTRVMQSLCTHGGKKPPSSNGGHKSFRERYPVRMTPRTQTVCLSTVCPQFVYRFPWTRRAKYSAALCGVCCACVCPDAPVAAGMTSVYMTSQEPVSAHRVSVSRRRGSILFAACCERSLGSGSNVSILHNDHKDKFRRTNRIC